MMTKDKHNTGNSDMGDALRVDTPNTHYKEKNDNGRAVASATGVHGGDVVATAKDDIELLDRFYDSMKHEHGMNRDEADQVLSELDDDPDVDRLLSRLEQFFSKY